MLLELRLPMSTPVDTFRALHSRSLSIPANPHTGGLKQEVQVCVCVCVCASEAYCKQTSSYRPDSVPGNPPEILSRCHLGHVWAVCLCFCMERAPSSLSPHWLLLTLPQKTQRQRSCFLPKEGKKVNPFDIRDCFFYYYWEFFNRYKLQWQVDSERLLNLFSLRPSPSQFILTLGLLKHTGTF